MLFENETSRVYRGRHRGDDVAVKEIRGLQTLLHTHQGEGERERGERREREGGERREREGGERKVFSNVIISLH